MVNSDKLETKKVIFFDGVCGLCNYSVDFLLKRDRKKVYLFSPLQSEYAKKNLPKQLTLKLNTMVLLDNSNIFTESTAVLKILKDLSLPWSLFVVFFLVPKFIRDTVYRVIGRNRNIFFKPREHCRIPTDDELNRFIL